jgi:RND family efflux transporter MFP subunit
MAGRPLEHVLRHLRRIAAPAAGGVADADLLDRFADGRDEAAFETLVWRHGPLVYGVCRRVLGHTQDAEDAFQAAFLILARKASAVRRRAAVAPWLYRVAQRVALRVRGRSIVAAPLPADLPAAPIPDAAERGDLRRVLDEEIGRLPARYRAAVVLRYLEGRTTTEAATALGCPPGTVLSRLAWARRRLRIRLAARGAALPAGLAAIGLGEAAGAVPARWVTAAVGAAGTFAAGSRTGRPALLAAEVLRTMLMSKLRVGAVFVFGALAAGAGLLLPGPTTGLTDGPDQAPMPVEVTVVRPTKRTTGESTDFVGRTAASATVEVRSRITSQIEKVAFHPGAKVKRGDLLFELDARPYQVEQERAQAEVRRAESTLRRGDADLSRLQRLAGAPGAVSETAIAHAKGTVDEAQAGVLVAKAGLERTRLDLDATRITSPIDGQTGGTVLSVGNLAAPTATLVTIVAADPVYVDFDVDERSILRLRKLFQHGDVTAQVGLSGDNDLPRHGKVVFVDNSVEPRVGTVRVRAVLPNSGGDILPGMFARVRLMIGEPREELVIPKAAVRQLNNGTSFVLAVGAGNAIEWRAVTLGHGDDTRQGVTAGIRPEDRVIVDSRLPAAGVPIRVHETNPPK